MCAGVHEDCWLVCKQADIAFGRYGYLAASPFGVRELSRILYLSIKISRMSRCAKLLASMARPILLGQVTRPCAAVALCTRWLQIVHAIAVGVKRNRRLADSAVTSRSLRMLYTSVTRKLPRKKSSEVTARYAMRHTSSQSGPHAGVPRLHECSYTCLSVLIIPNLSCRLFSWEMRRRWAHVCASHGSALQPMSEGTLRPLCLHMDASSLVHGVYGCPWFPEHLARQSECQECRSFSG